jgi:hypothetical protein
MKTHFFTATLSMHACKCSPSGSESFKSVYEELLSLSLLLIDPNEIHIHFPLNPMHVLLIAGTRDFPFQFARRE